MDEETSKPTGSPQGQAVPYRIEVRRKSPNHLSTWADNVQVSVNYFGLKVTFAEVMDVDREAGKVTVEDRVTVAMSPEHAATLVGLLQAQVKVYEERFGAIRKLPATPSPDQ